MLQLALRLVGNLDTAAERQRVAEFGLHMLSPKSDGGTRVTVAEWAKFGGKENLGILNGNKDE